MRPDAPPSDLLIAGASARAAAFSAVRAGLRVAAADLFADRDLAAVAEVSAISDWPDGIEAWAARFPSDVPLMYVGGLENEPELLDRLASSRPLYGTHGEALRAVRMPESLRSIAFDAGLPAPRLADSTNADSRTRWIVKPVKSAAGRGVRLWDGPGDPVGPGEYLQELVKGTPGSAAFLATGEGVELLGTTELLLPEDPPLVHLAPFTYVGSITSEGTGSEALLRLGERLAEVGLRGLFGVDFIRTEEGLIPIEVNPRYTAGMEVLELRSGRSFVGEHFAAFGAGGDVTDGSSGATGSASARVLTAHWRSQWHPASRDVGSPSDVRHAQVGVPPGCRGKRIVYAPRTLRTGRIPVPSREEITDGVYPLADIPAEGTVDPAGSPVCTVFASTATADECRAMLKAREAEVLAGCEPVG